MLKPEFSKFVLIKTKQKTSSQYKKVKEFLNKIAGKVNFIPKKLSPVRVDNRSSVYPNKTTLFVACLLLAASVTAILPRMSVAASLVYINGYPTLNGNYLDCNGNIDNDMGHHTTNPNDTDPGHRVGLNCPAGSAVASTVPAPSAPTAPVAVPTSIVYINGYPTLNGNYLDCNGNIDNDMGHHTTNPNDTDPGHRVGLNCQNSSPAAQPVIQPLPQPLPVPTTPSQPAAPNQAPSNPNNIFSGSRLYVNPYSDTQKQAEAWKYSRPNDAAQMQKIANGAESQWFGGWNSNIKNDVNNTVTAVTQAGALPVLVAYNIPNRDCGGYSAGGVNSPAAYRQWIRDFAAGIGNRKAAIILEPDATALTDCLSQTDLQTRFNLLKDAVSVFKNNGQAVYIDAAHPGWIPASEMSSRLKQSGIDQADGFALNVSNFNSTQANTAYGIQISDLTSGKHFVIDTGRNGNGSAPGGEWCNPSGRALGQLPTTSNTGNILVDALLWVKGPGGSDGNCNGGPNAGIFWPQYALDLAKNSP